MAPIVVLRTGILLLSIASRQAPFKAEGEDTAAVRQLTQQHKTWVSAEFFAPSCPRPPAAAASALAAFVTVPSSLEVSMPPLHQQLVSTGVALSALTIGFGADLTFAL